MIGQRFKVLLAVSYLALLVCTGCPKRKEIITIAPDLSATVELEFEGGDERIIGGDALPSLESGWEVVRSTKKDGDKTRHVLRSKRFFPPQEELPRSFAVPGDPDSDLYLDFPTTVRSEDRHDGRYFYFHRTYTARPWAYVKGWEEEFVDDEIEKLSDKPVEELTPDEQVKIVKAFAAVEAFKQIEFASLAIKESHPNLPVEYGLLARRALFDYYVQQDSDGVIERAMERCTALADPAGNECFDQEAERYLDGGYAAYLQSLRATGGLNPGEVAAFEQSYQRAERRYELTNGLGGHQFEITIRMPGTIIAHTGLDAKVIVDEEKGLSSVKLEFDGRRFRDRPFELIVVSRLSYDDGKKEGGHKIGHDR